MLTLSLFLSLDLVVAALHPQSHRHFATTTFRESLTNLTALLLSHMIAATT